MRTNGDKVFDSIIYTICVIVLMTVAYPLYFVIIASFSSPAEVANGNVYLFPKGITFKGYEMIMTDNRIWKGYGNTMIYAVLGTAFSLLFTIPAAYALSRKDFLFRNVIMLYFVFTMFFHGGLIPTYLLINNTLKMSNTIWVMIIPVSVKVFHLIIARTFFQTNLPKELLEAAKMDGCNNTRFFVQIAVPLSKPIIAVIGLFSIVSYWNEYFRPLIYLQKSDLQPLSLVLREILVRNMAFGEGVEGGDGGSAQQLADLIKYGVVIVSTLPILAVYPFIQKYFNKGVMIGSIKG